MTRTPTRPRRRDVTTSAPSTRAGRRLWPWAAVAAVLVLVAAGAVYSARTESGQPGGAISVLRTGDFHALAFSPSDPNVVFFGHHNGILRSDDGGRTWRPLVDRPGFDAMALGLSPADPRQVYLAGHDVFQVSTDGGRTWGPVQHTLPGTDVHAFAASPDDPNRLYALVVGHGVFASADGGRSWEHLPGAPAPTALVAAGGSPETLYAGTAGSGVLRSTDGGQTWAAERNELSGRGIAALAVDISSRRTLYAGINGGLYKSTDAGVTWRGLPFPGENAIAIAVSPARPEVVLAVEVRDRQGFVYRSEDGGQTWGGQS